MQPATPALDFLRKVEVWQDAPGGTAGIAVAMPEGEDTTLAGLLARARSGQPAAALEVQARWWLIGYREMNPPLTTAQRAELDAVIGQSAGLPHAQLGLRDGYERKFPPVRRAVLVVIAVVIAVAAGLSVSAAVDHARGVNPVQYQQNQQVAPPQQVQPGLTSVQQFRQDWDVPAGAQADAGRHPRALVLLENGLYYPTDWKLPAGDAAWAQDLSGAVTAVQVQGSTVVFQDQDGIIWTVSTGQPFVLAPDPGTIRKIGQAGKIWSMPASHGITVRTHL